MVCVILVGSIRMTSVAHRHVNFGSNFSFGAQRINGSVYGLCSIGWLFPVLMSISISCVFPICDAREAYGGIRPAEFNHIKYESLT